MGYKEGRSVMAETLDFLLKKVGNRGGTFFDDHPSTADRIRVLKKGA